MSLVNEGRNTEWWAKTKHANVYLDFAVKDIDVAFLESYRQTVSLNFSAT